MKIPRRTIGASHKSLHRSIAHQDCSAAQSSKREQPSPPTRSHQQQLRKPPLSLLVQMKLDRNMSLLEASTKYHPFREIHNHREKYQSLLSHQHTTSPLRKRNSRHLPDVPLLKRGQRKKAVRFNFRASTVYKSDITIGDEEHSELWYSKAEIRAFQRQTKNWMKDDETAHPLYAAWSHNLDRVYTSFCTIDTAKEILAILDSTPSVFHPNGLGMERRAVSHINEDAHTRRMQLYSHVERCQSAFIPDPVMRSKIMREGSRAISKPSRLYARHIAYTTAVADN